jgi:hypothetical protein
LPATGLKRNVEEANGSKEPNGHDGEANGDTPNRPHINGRASSSSSIPSNASGTDPRNQQERDASQEGARGRGPGGHEAEITKENGGPIVDSPSQEEGPGQPEFEENEAPKKGGAETRGDEPLMGMDGSKEGNGHDQSKTRTDRSRTLTDEAGRLPEGVPGVKEEAPPGPQNEIVLDPRISYLQVSLGSSCTCRGHRQWA